MHDFDCALFVLTPPEAVDFCTRSSDEEDIDDNDDDDDDDADDDDGVFAENNEDVVVDSTMFGNPDAMLSENEIEDLTSEEEQSDDDDDYDVDNGDRNEYDKRQFHPRKQKRMVCNIHTSLDEKNYELIDLSKAEKEEVVVVLEKKKKVVTNSITWTTEQQGPQNMKNPAGIKPEHREKIEPLDAWSMSMMI